VLEKKAAFQLFFTDGRIEMHNIASGRSAGAGCIPAVIKLQKI
jgi:hypothetical protein